MGQYNKKGLYAGYDKNHKEREALDYYATPTAEVTNILDILNLDFSNSSVLEPCCGGGHMAEGIIPFLKETSNLICTDIKDRGYIAPIGVTELGLDFFADDYPYDKADYVIMNPPFGVIEPFVIRALEISQKGCLMLGRLQFLEGVKRYESIFKENPPTDVWVYVDRIACYKNGDFSEKPNSIQAYAWFYWDKENKTKETKLHHIFRSK